VVEYIVAIDVTRVRFPADALDKSHRRSAAGPLFHNSMYFARDVPLSGHRRWEDLFEYGLQDVYT
jgi:hypothetical protein